MQVDYSFESLARMLQDDSGGLPNDIACGYRVERADTHSCKHSWEEDGKRNQEAVKEAARATGRKYVSYRFCLQSTSRFFTFFTITPNV